MKIPVSTPRLKGFRFPREIVAYAVWAYRRFALSTADVEDLLAERGVIVSRESVRHRVNRFGRRFADCIRRDRQTPRDKWHLDEAVIMIGGRTYWLWRAIDAAGDILDILVQSRRNAKAAKRFLRRLTARFGEPARHQTAFERLLKPLADVFGKGRVKRPSPQAWLSYHVCGHSKLQALPTFQAGSFKP